MQEIIISVSWALWIMSIIWEMLKPSWLSSLVLLAMTAVAVWSIYYGG